MSLTDNYKKHASKNPLQRLLIANYYAALLKIIGRLKIETVLDAGCGEGFTLAKLKNLGGFKRLEGVDNSPEAVALGRKIFPDLILKSGDVYRLPYGDNEFDLLIVSEVLEHLDRPETALAEIRRVAGKYCLISVPDEPFFRLANFLRGKNLSRLGSDVGHLNHWSSRAFKKLMEANGWRPLIIKKPFPWTMALGEKNN